MAGSTGSRDRKIISVLSLCLLAVAVVLTSCGGGGSTSQSGPPPTCPPCAGTETSFWAADFTTNTAYCLCAKEIDAGAHCRIFAENTFSLTPADVAWIKTPFDNNIYPSDTANFGSEPNPGIDGDPLITILLLNVRDGFNGTTVTSYTAGYFDPGNEYPLSANPYSNRREMFYMNINPKLILSATDFNTTLAHEFQHMIHWQQKSNLRGLEDDTWLNEAMSEAAPTFIYGPSCARLNDYEGAPSDSLTVWNGAVDDYGIAYMWAQYYKDQFGGNIFKSIMQQNSVGITSVNSALAAIPSGRTFASNFHDMSIAIGSGMTSATWWTGSPEWTYSVASGIETWPNTCGAYSIPGIFQQAPVSASTVTALGPWSVGFGFYEPPSPPFGTITWTGASPLKAALIDYGADRLYPNLVSALTYSYTTNGLLIVSNPSDLARGTGGNVARTAPTALGSALYQSPKQMLAAANRRAQAGGKPRGVCVHSAFTEKEKELRQKGFKPGF